MIFMFDFNSNEIVLVVDYVVVVVVVVLLSLLFYSIVSLIVQEDDARYKAARKAWTARIYNLVFALLNLSIKSAKQRKMVSNQINFCYCCAIRTDYNC